MDLGLRSAYVAVTGGTAGMGRATADCYAHEGARVAVLSRTQTALDVTSAELLEAGSPDAVGISTDLSDPDSVTAAFDEIADAVGQPQRLGEHRWPGARGSSGSSTNSTRRSGVRRSTS